MHLGRKPIAPAVHVVTEASRSRYDDIAARQRQYLIRMFIRTIAVLVAFFAPLPIWARVLAITAGLVLPMIAVTSANIGPLPDDRTMERLDVRALTTGIDVPSTPENGGQTANDHGG